MTADEYPVLSTDKLFRLKQVKRGEDNYSKILIIYSPKESFDEALFFSSHSNHYPFLCMFVATIITQHQKYNE